MARACRLTAGPARWGCPRGGRRLLAGTAPWLRHSVFWKTGLGAKSALMWIKDDCSATGARLCFPGPAGMAVKLKWNASV
jgi:hypothetical protein